MLRRRQRGGEEICAESPPAAVRSVVSRARRGKPVYSCARRRRPRSASLPLVPPERLAPARLRSGGGMKQEDGRYRWFALGDVNGFFGLMFDNVTVLSFLAGILVFAFGYPADIVYGRMFPGTAFGVLFGDLVYTWMAFQLARRTGRRNITAMPLRLDTPSTIGIALV